MNVTNTDPTFSTNGTCIILHVIERLTNDSASKVALRLSKHSTNHDQQLTHRVISLQRPTPEGLKLAELEGYEVDHGRGKPFLDYQIAQSDIVHLHWRNSPAILEFMRMDFVPSRMLVWCHVAGMHVPQVIVPELLEYGDVTVATNPTTFNELPAFSGLSIQERKLKTAMIVNPADFSRLDKLSAKDHEGFNVGYIGSVNHHRLHPHFMRMSSGIEIPDLKIIVCGSGVERELMLQARLLKSANRFSFLGHVDDMVPIFEQLDVFGYPLCEDTDVSGDLNLQEAMYAGIPPVVFPHGGIKGLIVDQYSGLLVDTEKEYQAAIEHLYHDAEDRQRIGQNARQVARQLYGASNAAPKLNRLYASLLERPKRRHVWAWTSPESDQFSNNQTQSSAASAASQYILSLGDQGHAYRTSLTSRDFQEALEADDQISQMSPLAHMDGILEYLSLHTQDAWLRFWSGLAFLGHGNGAKALSEFAKAKTHGCTHDRLSWHIARAAALSLQWDLVEQCLSELKQSQPDFKEAEKLWDQRPEQHAKLQSSNQAATNDPREIIQNLETLIEKGETKKAVALFSSFKPEDILESPHAFQFIEHASRLGLKDWVIQLALKADKGDAHASRIQQLVIEKVLRDKNKPAFFQLIESRLNSTPEDASSHRFLAQWYIGEEEFLKAAQHLARSLQTEPGHVPTLKLLAQCFHQAGESASEKLTLEEINRLESTQDEMPERTSPDTPASGELPQTTSTNKEELEPLVTVCVSVNSDEQCMEACLNGLLRQTLNDRLDILVIDNASPEKEGVTVKHFQEKHTNIRYVRMDAQATPGEVWNRGVGESRGKYIVNVNTRDAYRDDAFELLAQTMEKHDGTGLAYADCVWTSKSNDHFSSEHITKEVRYPDYHPGLSLFYPYTACLQFWSKSTLSDLGLFDTRLKSAGHHEILMRAAKKGVRVAHVSELLSLQYQDSQSGKQELDLMASEEQPLKDAFRAQLDIGSIYCVDTSSVQTTALAWYDLAELAFTIRIPWQEADSGDNAFAIHCLQQSLQSMHDNELAASNLLWLLGEYGQLDAGKKFLKQLGDYWTEKRIGALVLISTHWNAASEAQSDDTAKEQEHKMTAAPIRKPACALVGDIRSAVEAFNAEMWQESWMACVEAITQRPFHPEAYLLLGKVAALTRNYAKAKQCAGILKKMVPQWEEAKQFKKKLSKKPASVKPRCKLGDVPATAPNPRVSVCMIVRDEEKQIGQCLKSVADLAHEIIVLDTGSKDATREKAAAFGAKVLESKWNDHFGEARNHSLEHARGDWLLILDADETLDPESIQTLKKEIQSQGVMAYRLPLVNQGIHERGNNYVPRLLRNAPGLFFVNRIHEEIFSSMEVLRRRWNLDCRLGQSLINHFGYTEEQVNEKQKKKRNLKLLEKAVIETPDEPNLLMNYGLELARTGANKKALEQYEQAFSCLQRMPDQYVTPEFRETLIHQFAHLLIQEQAYQRLLEIAAMPVVRDHVKTASLYFYLGLAQTQRGMHDYALESLQACIDTEDDPAFTPVINEVQTGIPHFFMAKIHARRKNLRVANDCFGLALERSPDNINIIIDYARFLNEIDHALEALQILHRYIKVGSSEMQYWILGAEIALAQKGMKEFALDWTSEAIKFFGSEFKVLFLHIEALIVNQKWEEAFEFKTDYAGDPVTARHAAQWMMIDMVAGQKISSADPAREQEFSLAFIKMYRQLIDLNDGGAIHKINGASAQLEKILPTAYKLLSDAIQSTMKNPAPQST